MPTIKYEQISVGTTVFLKKDTHTFSGIVLAGTAYRVSSVGERGYDLDPINPEDPQITEAGWTSVSIYDHRYHGKILANGMVSHHEADCY